MHRPTSGVPASTGPNTDTRGQCGTPTGPDSGETTVDRQSWWLWALITVGGVIILICLCVLGIVLTRTGAERRDGSSGQMAIKAWWSSAHEDVNDLQNALDDSQRAMQRKDSAAFEDACRRMHDSAAVSVQTHLPSPDSSLTAELSAAAEDAHAASHMCLAVLADSLNNYDGEFLSTTEQAEKHLRIVTTFMDETLTA